MTSISDKLLEVRTQSYVLTSISPTQTVTPTVVPGDEPRFIGGSFFANQVLYAVDGFTQSTVLGEGAVFRIRKQTQSTVDDLNNQQSTSVRVAVPSTGDRAFPIVRDVGILRMQGPSSQP